MLFLQESVSSGAPLLTLEEAQVGLLETTMQMGALTEAAMQADFFIHSSLNEGVLSENDAKEKKEGVFSKVAARVRELLTKARDYIMNVFRNIKERLSKLWTRIMGRETITVAKGSVKLLEGLFAAFEKVSTVVQVETKDATQYKAKVDTEKTAFDKLKDNLSKTVKGTTETEDTRTKALSKMQAFINNADKLTAVTRSALTKEITELAKVEKEKTISDANRTILGKARARMSGFTTLSNAAGAVSSSISTVLHSGSPRAAK